ncbi:MAG: cytochrome c biogenesis protein ResB, partial [Anaerolineaceae bacterium]
MTAPSSTASQAFRPSGFDPLRTAWNLLTNVKFALTLVGVALVAGMIGVVIPQVPGPMRANPAARSAWMELRRDDFGSLTATMDRAGLFDVFHSSWFNGLWLVIILAVTVCTVSRFRPTWRSVHHPTKSVGDGYFESAHHSASFTHAGGVEAVDALLRKKRYRVERTHGREGATYLFAERYSWSQYGTFVSHLALLMLLVGALLTTLAGFDRTLVIAEGTPGAPVFDSAGPNQIFVTMVDAVRGKDGSGNIIDFHSTIQVRRGDQTVTCQTSVNDPCTAFGYKVHQAAWFNDLARLKVTSPDGRVLYNDVLDFESRSTAVPVMRVTDASGAVLFDQELPQMETDTGASAGPEDDVALSLLTFPKSALPGETGLVTYAVGWRVVQNVLRLTLTGENFPAKDLPVGQSASDAGYTFTYADARPIPAQRVGGMPGATSDDGAATVQMVDDRAGNSYLFVSGIDLNNVVLTQGNPVKTSGGFTYEMLGRVEASGVSVRRDPGDTFIWLAVGMAIIGLAITFYIPRRRLWVKVSDSRTYLAGVAERTTRFGRELRFMGAALGA